VHVQNRQQREPDARRRRGPDQGATGGRGVAVGCAVRPVVQVVELAHRGVAGLEHLDVQQGGDGFEIVRGNPLGQCVHPLPPGHEGIQPVPRLLGPAGQGALERVAVHVGHAGHQDRRRRAGTARPDCGNPPCGVDLDRDIGGPAVRQQRAMSVNCGQGDFPEVV